MSKLTLPIEAGKSYVRRDGTVITIDNIKGEGAWLSPARNCGVHVVNGAISLHGESMEDLVADYGTTPSTFDYWSRGAPKAKTIGHVHAASMLLYAQDAAESDEPWRGWGFRDSRSSEWQELSEHPSWMTDCDYRRKPPEPVFILINGFKVPEPMRVAPADGTRYFALHLITECVEHMWSSDEGDRALLDAGICHLTREATEIHATAVLSFTKVKT